MRDELLELIDKIDDIKSYFHISGGNGLPQLNVIYDRPEFSRWKQELQLELQGLQDRTKDQFIYNTLENLKQGFNGWRDERSFNELSASLLAIKKYIEKYYPLESENRENIQEVSTMKQKKPKIFISHSSKDKNYVSQIVDFLEDIGLRSKQLFCSSVPGYNIPLSEDIYDYLKKQFQDFNLHVVFVLSKNYYESVACMNEMGAAWVLQNKYTTVLLPGFEFNEIKGAINPRQIGMKLDGDIIDIKEKLDQLKDLLTHEFGLEQIQGVHWEQKRDAFISTILQSTQVTSIISSYALKLLQAACEADDGTILMTRTLSGTDIQVKNLNFATSQERREIAKWEGCLDELLQNSLVQSRDQEGSVFVVTQKGYDFIEELQ
jgi:predicted transcriptional regulator